MRKLILTKMLFLIFSIYLYSAPFMLRSGHYDSVTDIAKYPYGSIAISVSNDESIIIWDVNQNKILKNIEFGKGSLTSIAISPSGKYFVVGNSRGEIFVFDFASQKMLFSDKLHQAKITDICFAGRENLFFTGGEYYEKISCDYGVVEFSGDLLLWLRIKELREGTERRVGRQNQ